MAGAQGESVLPSGGVLWPDTETLRILGTLTFNGRRVCLDDVLGLCYQAKEYLIGDDDWRDFYAFFRDERGTKVHITLEPLNSRSSIDGKRVFAFELRPEWMFDTNPPPPPPLPIEDVQPESVPEVD